MQNEPIIRYCANCEYNERIGSKYDGSGCLVTYRFIFKPRLKALFCRYFKAKGGGKDAE